jgi:hypothetical protein
VLLTVLDVLYLIHTWESSASGTPGAGRAGNGCKSGKRQAVNEKKIKGKYIELADLATSHAHARATRIPSSVVPF